MRRDFVQQTLPSEYRLHPPQPHRAFGASQQPWVADPPSNNAALGRFATSVRSISQLMWPVFSFQLPLLLGVRVNVGTKRNSDLYALAFGDYRPYPSGTGSHRTEQWNGEAPRLSRLIFRCC